MNVTLTGRPSFLRYRTGADGLRPSADRLTKVSLDVHRSPVLRVLSMRGSLGPLLIVPLALPLLLGASRSMEAVASGRSALPWLLLVTVVDLILPAVLHLRRQSRPLRAIPGGMPGPRTVGEPRQAYDRLAASAEVDVFFTGLTVVLGSIWRKSAEAKGQRGPRNNDCSGMRRTPPVTRPIKMSSMTGVSQ